MVSPGGDSTFHASAGPDNDRGALLTIAGVVCLVWYTAVMFVSLLGYTQLWRYYSKAPSKSISSNSTDAPAVTIIRPVKGLEPNLYDCLASTFRQDYGASKLKIFFCISEPTDPSLPILQQLLEDFPSFDAHILVETEDALLQSRSLGPNPKIRNMSRAYREAEGDIVWIIDCNVWVGCGALGRMVDTLATTPAKFVHLLPLVVDVTPSPGLASPASSTSSLLQSGDQPPVKALGGRLEESFMSSSHAKFYTAINTVLLAPCIVGKSTMFRRSHLDYLTQGQGIDFFARNICEDHLIGDLLWRKDVPAHPSGKKWQNHALVWGDLAVQPMAGMSVKEYIARRVRWLRVRKFTVTLATLVEPGTESFLCSIYGAFAARTFGWIGPSFFSAMAFWLLSVGLWCLTDYTLYRMLQSGRSIEVDEHTPGFCRPRKRDVGEWFIAWLGREALAFPVWAWAVYGGVTVTWRGKRFWVGWDMMVHEVKDRRCD